eukprot:jgi/Tetstr1/466177/TSEL_010737.t1
MNLDEASVPACRLTRDTDDRHTARTGMPLQGRQGQRRAASPWGDALPDILADVVFERLESSDAGRARLTCTAWRARVDNARTALRLRLGEQDADNNSAVSSGRTKSRRLDPSWLANFTRLTSLKLEPPFLGIGPSHADIVAVGLAARAAGGGRRYPAGGAVRPWLTSLDLADCVDVRDASLAAALPPLVSSLTRLDLSGCAAVTDSCLEATVGQLPSLRWLALSGCTAVSDAGLAGLASGPAGTSLTHLDISAYALDCRPPLPGLSDAGLGAALVRLPALRYLNLAGLERLGAAGLAPLAAAAGLTYLNISHSAVNDAALAALAPLAHLQSLCLSHTDVGPRGLQYLGQLGGLTHLDLSGCGEVADDGLLELASLVSLRFLSLSDCWKITDRGLAGLKPLHALATLNLGNYIYEDCMHVTDRGLAALADLTALTALDLHECGEGVTDRGLGMLTRLTNITSLNVALCQGVSDSGLEAIQHLRAMRHLDLTGCTSISDNGIPRLAGLSQLKHLALSACPQVPR